MGYFQKRQTSSIAAMSLALLLAFAFLKGLAAQTTERASEDALSQQHAEERASRVSNIEYHISIDLTAAGDHFLGRTKISFDLTEAANQSDLTVDFSGGQIESVTINDLPVRPQYNGAFITFPGDYLKSGHNDVQISYQHDYSKDGTGLHHFQDPVDGQRYLYTYLWPYYANRVFPNFDQPDLKAIFNLMVLAPRGWQVVSTTRESHVRDLGDKVRWSFPPTQKMSSYIFSLHAGPYKMWESDAGPVPMRLFARQSLADYVAVDDWFDVTAKGLNFFNDYYDIPYPFEKYDQLIVPDFNIGAMENIAAVTFTENYVSRGQESDAAREGRASTILHEMAHMWFGDLVTKKWWNGLWLNESFATQMASIALRNVTEFQSGSHRFFLSSKRTAYAVDDRVSTHPIEMPVPSTADFYTVFDSITYSKGSSVLMQLEQLVTPEKYRQGVSDYLKKHAYQNTTLEDFISALSTAHGEDLMPWAKDWLYTVGFNTISSDFSCQNGRLSTISFIQAVDNGDNLLRDHKMQWAAYGRDLQGRLNRLGTGMVMVSGTETTDTNTNNIACPAFILPNFGDWGYMKVTLSDNALAALENKVNELPEPLTRSMIWASLYDMTLSGQIPYQRFMNWLMAESAIETNGRVRSQMLAYMSAMQTHLTLLGEAANELHTTISKQLEDMAWQRASSAEAGSALQRQWFNLYHAIVSSPVGLNRLRVLMDGQNALQGFVVDQELRWQIIQTLASHQYPSAQNMIALERQKDPSDAGEKAALTAEAALPDSIIKSGFIAQLLDDQSNLGLAKARSILAGLFPSHQRDFASQFAAEALNPLAAFSRQRDGYFMVSYVNGLLPVTCDATVRDMKAKALETPDNYSLSVLKFLRESLQDEDRCLAAKARLP